MLEQYKGLRRENYILAFGRLVTGLGSMIWPMMTLILSQKMGVGARDVSVLLSIAMVLMAPAVYLGGKIADKYDKKMTIVLLDLVSVACFVTSAIIPLTWISIVLLFIGSVGQNMENPVYNALTADISTTDERDRSYSLQYLCANLGLVMSPTIAGLLFKDYLWLAFLINGLSILCSAILIFFMVRDTTPAIETSFRAEYQKERPGENIFSVLRSNPVILLFILVISGYFTVYQLGYVYLMPLDLAVMHGDSGAVIYGTVTSINCVVVVLFTPVITRLFGDKSEPVRLISGVSLLFAGFIMFILFIDVIPVYYISMTILTWGEVFTMTAESPYLTRRIPSSHRGRLNGMLTVIRTLVTSAFQVILGTLYEARGSDAAWKVIMGLGLLTILLSFLVMKKDRVDYSNLYISEKGND